MALNFLNNGYFAGKVGIGTESPSAKLDVQGTILVNNEIQFVDANMRIFRSSNDMRIRTGGSDKVTILSGGNVGIGTTSPNSKLTVSGPATPSLANGENSIRIERHASAAASPGELGNGINFAQKWWSGSADLQVTGGIYGIKNAGNGTYGGGLAFYTQPSSAADMAQRMVIDTDGNVGIGETSPSSKLVVAENINPAITILDTTTIPAGTQNAGNNITFGTLQFQWGAESYSYMPSIEARFNETDASFGRKAGLDFKVGNVASVTAMSILSSGEVGIGTTSPGTINSVAFSGVGLHVKSGTLGRTITEGSNEASYLLNNSGASANQRIKYIQSTAGNLAIGSFDDNGLARPQMTVLNSGSVGIGNTAPIFYSGYSSITLGGTYGSTGGLIKFGTATSNDGPEIFATTAKDLYFNKSGSGTNMILYAAGTVRFNNYDSTNQTGTPTYLLGTDASGYVVKVLGSDIPGIPGGSGTLNTVPLWTPDGDTLGDSPITISGNDIISSGRGVIENTTNLTTGVADSLLIKTLSSGTTITNGFGGGLSFYLENTVYSAVNEVGKIAVIETDTIAIDDKMVFFC